MLAQFDPITNGEKGLRRIAPGLGSRLRRFDPFEGERLRLGRRAGGLGRVVATAATGAQQEVGRQGDGDV